LALKVIHVKKLLFAALLAALLVGAPFLTRPALAQDDKIIALPLPERVGGLPLNEALNLRRSHRNFLTQELDLSQLSQLLWAAFGVNREAGKMRTIPTSHNRQNLLIFVVLKSGVWVYEAEKNQLALQLQGDHTKAFGSAPATFLYVVPTADGVVGGLHVGLAAQDVGLTCASLGLANVIKTTGADNLKGKLPLPSGYHTVAIHNVGPPAGFF
jgi:nitroreductase